LHKGIYRERKHIQDNQYMHSAYTPVAYLGRVGRDVASLPRADIYGNAQASLSLTAASREVLLLSLRGGACEGLRGESGVGVQWVWPCARIVLLSLDFGMVICGLGIRKWWVDK
jgi:hypothetical protein